MQNQVTANAYCFIANKAWSFTSSPEACVGLGLQPLHAEASEQWHPLGPEGKGVAGFAWTMKRRKEGSTKLV